MIRKLRALTVVFNLMTALFALLASRNNPSMLLVFALNVCLAAINLYGVMDKRTL